MAFSELREYLNTTCGKDNIPTVVIEKANEENLNLIRDAICYILSSSGVDQLMRQWRHQKVLLKPNFCRAGLYGETSSIQAIDAILGILKDYSCQLIFGDGMTQAYLKRFQEVSNQLSHVVRKHNVEFVHFDESREERCSVEADGFRFYLPKWIKEISAIVNLAALKVHPQMVGSFAVKNHMGLLSGTDRLHLHRRGIAAGIWYLQSCLGKVVPQQVHIVDGIVSFQGYDASPSYLKPGIFIGGLNPCAVDFTCAQLMGIDPRTQFPQYRVALENDFAYGVEKPIELLGVNLDDMKFQCNIPDQILDPPSSFPSVRIHWGRFEYPLNQSLKDLFRAMDCDLPIDIYVGGAIPESVAEGRLCVCLGNESADSYVGMHGNVFKIPGDPPAGSIFRNVVTKIKSMKA